jgi:hypothetical protein
MRENSSAQDFVLVNTIVDRHSKAREHNADEPTASVSKLRVSRVEMLTLRYLSHLYS